MVLLQSISFDTRLSQMSKCVIIILAGLPNLAVASDGDSGGIPLWVYPAGLLLITIIIKVVQGNNENTPAQRKRRAAARRKTARNTTITPRENTPVTATTLPERAIVTTPVESPTTSIERSAVAETPIKDALEDAQDYIDRERYSEASIILKGAIQQVPERTDLQLKLLEIHALQHDTAAFEARYNLIASFKQPEALLVANSLRPLLTQGTHMPEEVKQSAPMLTDMPIASVLPTLTTTVHTNKQSLASLEAEFGLDRLHTENHHQPVLQQTHASPAASFQALDFDLGDYEPTPLKIADRKAITPDFTSPAPEHAGNLLDFEATKVSPPEPTMITTESLDWPHIPATAPLSIDIGNQQPDAAPQHINMNNHLTQLNDLPALASLDLQQTNLELADSYLRLGEKSEACELLKEVIYRGNAQQKEQAQQLMTQISNAGIPQIAI